MFVLAGAEGVGVVHLCREGLQCAVAMNPLLCQGLCVYVFQERARKKYRESIIRDLVMAEYYYSLSV